MDQLEAETTEVEDAYGYHQDEVRRGCAPTLLCQLARSCKNGEDAFQLLFEEAGRSRIWEEGADVSKLETVYPREQSQPQQAGVRRKVVLWSQQKGSPSSLAYVGAEHTATSDGSHAFPTREGEQSADYLASLCA